MEGSYDAMLACFQFQHAGGIVLLTAAAQAAGGTTAPSVQTMSGTVSAYWSVLTMSVELKKRHA